MPFVVSLEQSFCFLFRFFPLLVLRPVIMPLESTASHTPALSDSFESTSVWGDLHVARREALLSMQLDRSGRLGAALHVRKRQQTC